MQLVLFVPALGESCITDEYCSTENSVCVNSTCHCADNYYEAEDKCLRGIAAECNSDSDCGVNSSVCKNNTCACIDRYVAQAVNLCVPGRGQLVINRKGAV